MANSQVDEIEKSALSVFFSEVNRRKEQLMVAGALAVKVDTEGGRLKVRFCLGAVMNAVLRMGVQDPLSFPEEGIIKNGLFVKFHEHPRTRRLGKKAQHTYEIASSAILEETGVDMFGGSDQ